MALAHHDAAERDQRSRRDAHFVGAQQRRDGDVAPRTDAAVALHTDAAAQLVEHERLVRLGEADFPRRTGMHDRRDGRGARAAVTAGDQDMVGVRLGDAGRDRSDADDGDQFDADARLRVHVLQIVDQLLQILDRIDVVMRRRRDQADARRRMTHARDHRVDLMARKLTAFAGLRALRHLDLDLVRVAQIFRSDAEMARGHLLDGGAFGISVGHRLETFGFFAAFARVGASADAVHGDSQGRMRLVGDRAEGHRAAGETLHDFGSRFDLVQRDRRVGPLEFEQAAQLLQLTRIVVHRRRELPVDIL